MDNYRMYGLVPYNISPIQQGIQFGHAVVEYGLRYGNDQIYLDWAKNNKTFIILNGGTTNNNHESLGSLNMHLDTLKSFRWKHAVFHEPDLGGQLTAVVFILPAVVYDKKKYPDYADWLEINGIEDGEEHFAGYVQMLGGVKNFEMRKFVSQFRLA